MNWKHAPGPWTIGVEEDDDTHFCVFPHDAFDDAVDGYIDFNKWEDRCVAQAGLNRPDEERNANLLLICAAPEMREALCMARDALAIAIRMNWSDATDEDIDRNVTIRKIDHALASASGES
jgi:hypothetical protein